MDEVTLTLSSPMTEEQWDMIADYDFNYTNEITFRTKHGKTVRFVKESAQPTQANDSNTLNALDCISRQAAIDAMEGLPKYFDTTDTLCLDYADVLAVLSEHLPSAQPEQNNLMADAHKRLINETGCKAVCRNEQWWGRGSNADDFSQHMNPPED